MRNLKTVLEELEIGYSMPVQPVYVQPTSWAAARAVMEGNDLGNAGVVQSDPTGRAPGPSIRSSGDSF
jgi:hypothetical protein